MSSRVNLISLSAKPLRVVHESQFVVMMLRPGAMDLSIDGAPTERFEYMAGDLALCCRQAVGFVRSPDRIKGLRLELSDFQLSEAAGEANREIGLQRIPKLKDSRIRALMTAVNIERASGFPSGELFLQSVEVALAAVLVQTYSLSKNARRLIKGGLSDFGRRNVIDLVRSRISEDISLADMAAVTGLSITHFSHIFKKSMGESPHQFVLQQRVLCAKELLVSLNLRVIDIALACGFKTQQHFARIFRQVCGLSPTEYRRLKSGKRLRDLHVGSRANSAGLRSSMNAPRSES
ncbi:AraC family transcriptional regulator [Granulicella sp. dw_53]|uniref:helix-turn-helix domain-containing protein n=1 Tax=Granulicella sp. dw_53 TaxID=2719792 RepID=UPI001BD3521C|nr:AraC family transcriptional regulator [Granulicella sp. dw_53]